MQRTIVTEGEWRTSENAYRLLNHFRGTIRSHGRKLRLFAVACCRRIEGRLRPDRRRWPFIDDRRSRTAIDVAEQHADGTATDAALRAAYEAALAAHQAAFAEKGKLGASAEWAAAYAAHHLPFFAATRASNFAFVAAGDGLDAGPEHAAQADLLRCIFGNPFRPLTIDPAWRSPPVVALATTIYDSKNFEAMPVLGAALSDAGCEDPVVLGHCVAETPHVRGCHLIDLLLNKS